MYTLGTKVPTNCTLTEVKAQEVALSAEGLLFSGLFACAANDFGFVGKLSVNFKQEVSGDGGKYGGKDQAEDEREWVKCQDSANYRAGNVN